MSEKKKILFLCTGNSCRSQMAEGWAIKLLSNYFDVYSAGLETHGLNPNAVKVMAKAGVDISNHKSNHVDEFSEIEYDFVVTVCDNALEHCPYYPAKTRVLHRSFEDPPRLAQDAKTEEEALAHYRRVRDEIKEFVLSLPKILNL